MATRTKILYVTTALSSPLHTGCAIRTLNISGQLNQFADVAMLAVSRVFAQDSVQYAKEQFERFEQIKLLNYDNLPSVRGSFLKKWHMHWPSSRGLQADLQGQRLFENLVNQHDVVWFHTLGAAFPFRLRRFPRSVMDLDDLNMCKYDLRSQQDQALRLRLSARVQAFKWKRHELNALREYDRVVVCSQNDKDFLGGDGKICIVPNGFTRPEVDPVWTPPDPLRLGFIGTLGYGPNADGLRWFRDQVWPKIRQQQPEMKLRIVGSLPQPQYRVDADGFEYLGYIQDPTDEIRSWSAMVVPIPYGGGTRIKIIEAFSRMCPVVSTAVGAHGIAAEHQQHLLLADTAEDFARSCLELSNRPQTAKQLTAAAWQLFSESYTWDRIGRMAQRIVQDLVR